MNDKALPGLGYVAQSMRYGVIILTTEQSTNDTVIIESGNEQRKYHVHKMSCNTLRTCVAH